jgi:hypothetical protein
VVADLAELLNQVEPDVPIGLSVCPAELLSSKPDGDIGLHLRHGHSPFKNVRHEHLLSRATNHTIGESPTRSMRDHRFYRDELKQAFAAYVETELGRAGIEADILLIHFDGKGWLLQLTVAARTFVTGVNHRGLSCWDMSPGNEKNLISPGVGPIFGDPRVLFRKVAQLLQYAISHPQFCLGEPPTI